MFKNVSEFPITRFFDWGAIAGAAAGLIDTGANVWMQSAANKGQHDLVTQMYAQQRKDALADWNMQNAYNSPAAQMERYKAAGLNPNLIYGQSNVSSPVRSSSVGNYSPAAPKLNTADALSRYFDIKQQEAQIDNVKATRNLIDKQAALLDSQKINTDAATEQTGYSIKKTDVDTQRANFELDMAKALRLNSLEQAYATLQKTQVETGYILSKNEREALMNAQDLRTGVERILNLRMQTAKGYTEQQNILQLTENLKKDYALKELDRSMKAKGIWWNDPLYARIVGNIVGENTMNKISSLPDKLSFKGIGDAMESVTPKPSKYFGSEDAVRHTFLGKSGKFFWEK